MESELLIRGFRSAHSSSRGSDPKTKRSGTMKQTQIEEAIEEVLARPQSANTMKNMRQVAGKLLPLLRECDIHNMDELNTDKSTLGRTATMNRLIEAMKVESTAGNLGGTFNTVQSRTSRMRLLLQKAGLDPQMVAMLKDAEKVINRASGLRRTQSQATITPEQAQRLIEFGELLSRGELPQVKIDGRTPTACKIAQGHTYTLTAMCYALRHESLMGLTWGDVTPQSLIFIVGKGNDFPEEHLRTMEPILWTEICKLNATWKEQPDSTAKLFINESWLYAYIRQACEYAGIERTNGRYGLHRARRAFATWCFTTKGINLEDASAGLTHWDTAVTERVYVGLSARQMRGNETLNQFREEFLGMSTEMASMKEDITEMKSTMGSLMEAFLEFGQSADVSISSDRADMMNQAFNITAPDNFPFQEGDTVYDVKVDSELSKAFIAGRESALKEMKGVTDSSSNLEGATTCGDKPDSLKDRMQVHFKNARTDLNCGSSQKAELLMTAMAEVFA